MRNYVSYSSTVSLPPSHNTGHGVRQKCPPAALMFRPPQICLIGENERPEMGRGWGLSGAGAGAGAGAGEMTTVPLARIDPQGPKLQGLKVEKRLKTCEYVRLSHNDRQSRA